MMMPLEFAKVSVKIYLKKYVHLCEANSSRLDLK